MAQIKAFKALHYNPSKIEDFSKVICPPYDVISKEQHNQLKGLSPYNFIHVMLSKDDAKYNGSDEKYARAQRNFENWVKNQVLVEDSNPSIYFYKQEYKILGTRHSRLGFIALMKLSDDKDSNVFAHEKTHDAAKEDRMKLWSSVKSNLSPIFVGFSDKDRKVEGVFSNAVMDTDPLIDLKDNDGVRHILWRLDDPRMVKMVEKALSRQKLFIADGHHRYEVACQYRDKRLKNRTKANEESAFNYVMTYFTNMDSKDLQVLPMHRIVKKLDAPLDFLEKFFRIDKIKSKEDLVILLAKAGKNEHAFGLYTREGIKLLRLKNRLLITEHIREGSDDYKRLDATILKTFVFDQVDVQTDDIIYTKDLQYVVDLVDSGKADAGFIMNAVKIDQIRRIALNGERMPPKTTYFYPKVLSGLTVYKME